LTHRYGGVTATSAAARQRSQHDQLRHPRASLGRNDTASRVRRRGGRKSAVAHQPELPAALELLIEDAIRGDLCSPLRWISRSLRHLVKALAAQGVPGQVANLLRELKNTVVRPIARPARVPATRTAMRSSRISTRR
jgi:hypothetical protein